MKKLNILIISYYWPPSGGSGVQRWMYFAKYLKKLNCNPIVLTVDPKYASYNLIDPSLISEIKDIETHKTFSLEVLNLYSLIKSGTRTKSIPQSYIPNNSVFDKISSFIRLNFFIPDSRIGWNIFAFKKAKKIISNNKIDFVITTGPPHSSHLIGQKIYKKYKLKWIVDLRDPWSELFYLKSRLRSSFSKKINNKLESKVLKNADAIITTVGDRYHKILSGKISNPNKIHKIYNGYDKLNYDKIQESKPNKFNIVFTGVLTQNHNYEIFHEVLKILKPKGEDLNLVFTVAGRIDSDIIKVFSNDVELINKGYVDHDNAINIIKSSHLLVNFNYKETEETDMISGKLIEYLASGSPIINFSNSAKESEDVLKISSKSFNANINSINKVVDFIKSEYNNWLEGRYKKQTLPDIDSLSRENLTKKLIDIIEGIN
ncbi:MAG: glycosyltransferase [Flavobacteriaceae bacterium]|nr:glycosyltransferase [Flavobacteriaceae bacterium]